MSELHISKQEKRIVNTDWMPAVSFRDTGQEHVEQYL